MRPFFSGIILLLILLVGLYIPLEIPYFSESIGKVLPVQEWQILQDQTGRLSSIIRDNKTGAAKQIDSYQFEQGDFSGLHIEFPESGYIQAGDTIVRMYSLRQGQEIQQIEAELALYNAQLNADKTGDKPPIVQEAENKLNFAEQDLKLKESLYEIQKRLVAEGLIARTEFQETENAYHLAEIQIEIAKKTLETVNTGLKIESVDVTEAQLLGLRNRLSLLKRKGLSFVLTAPFSGYIVPSLLPEALLVLQSSDEYLIHIPMKVEQLTYLDSTSVIKVTDVKSLKTFDATWIGSLPKVEILDNRQVALVTALVRPDSLGTRLSTGISTRCLVDFGKINQREYISRILNFKWN